MHSTDIRLEWPKYELHKNCILHFLTKIQISIVTMILRPLSAYKGNI